MGAVVSDRIARWVAGLLPSRVAYYAAEAWAAGRGAAPPPLRGEGGPNPGHPEHPGGATLSTGGSPPVTPSAPYGPPALRHRDRLALEEAVKAGPQPGQVVEVVGPGQTREFYIAGCPGCEQGLAQVLDEHGLRYHVHKVTRADALPDLGPGVSAHPGYAKLHGYFTLCLRRIEGQPLTPSPGSTDGPPTGSA